MLFMSMTQSQLKNLKKLSEEQFQELSTNGTITVDGQTLTYSDNVIYVTPDETSAGGAEGSASAKKYQHNINFSLSNKDYTLSFIDTNNAVYTKVGDFKNVLLNNGFIDSAHCLPCTCVTETGYSKGFGIMHKAFIQSNFLTFFGYEYNVTDGTLTKSTLSNAIPDTTAVNDVVVEV